MRSSRLIKFIIVVTLLLICAPNSFADIYGRCTLPGGGLGAECNGRCLPIYEAVCCQAGCTYNPRRNKCNCTVPEPSALLLMGGVIVGLVVIKIWKKRA